MTTTPPGWHDDRHGSVRWWDGAQWTEHVQPPMTPVAPPEGYAVPPPVAGAIPPPVAPAVGYAVPTTPEHAMPPAEGVDTPSASGEVPPARRPRKKTAQIVGAGALLVVILAVGIPLSLNAGPAIERQEAVAAVELYYASWQEADCEKFEEATTANHETQWGFGNCDLFREEARRWSYSIDDYELRVTAVERVGDEFFVSSTETYTAFVDEDGKAWPDGFDAVVENTDRVIEEDGAWRVDYRR